MPAYEPLTDSMLFPATTLISLLELIANDFARTGCTGTTSAILRMAAQRLRETITPPAVTVVPNAAGIDATMSCGHHPRYRARLGTEECSECKRLHQLDEKNARRIVCALDSEIFSEWRADGVRTPRMVDTVYASLVSVVAAKLMEFRRADAEQGSTKP